MKNLDDTICSQYANSPTLMQLLINMNQYLDPRANLLAFYDYVWNVDTAQGFGLNIWGKIVGVSRVIPLTGTSGIFGFDNSDIPSDWENFGNVNASATGGPFFAGQITTGGYSLNDDSYRTLILTKALANICATTAPALNALVQNLFPNRGRAYTIDRGQSNSSVGGMRMSYVFEFSLSNIEQSILRYSGVLPHPAGVYVDVIVVPTGTFGFAEASSGDLAQPFNYGTFYNG